MENLSIRIVLYMVNSMTKQAFRGFGVAMAAQLMAASMKPAHLAKLAGCSKGFVSDVLHGKKTPSISEAKRWFSLMKIDEQMQAYLLRELAVSRDPINAEMFSKLDDAEKMVQKILKYRDVIDPELFDRVLNKHAPAILEALENIRTIRDAPKREGRGYADEAAIREILSREDEANERKKRHARPHSAPRGPGR